MKFEWLDFGEFSDLAVEWDALWESSDSANPMLRSASLQAAICKFYEAPRFSVAAVRDTENRLVAALPFVSEKLKGLFSCLALPNNSWGQWGDLLVRQSGSNREQLFSTLVNGILSSTKTILRLGLIENKSATWKRFLHVAKTSNHPIHSQAAYFVGLIRHRSNWQQFQGELSKGFRKKLKKYNRGLTELGNLTFEHHTNFEGLSVMELVRQAFEIEDASWKGVQSTSVIASDMLGFYSQQAELLAKSGQLSLCFLKLAGIPIAFEFGTIAKGTYSSIKIGYLDDYSRFAPGQVLAAYLTESLHRSGCRIQDTFGPLSDATQRWATHHKLLSNVTIAGQTISSRFLVGALRTYRNFGQRDDEPVPVVGLTPVLQQSSSR